MQDMKGSNLEGCSWLQQQKVVGNRAQEHGNKKAREVGREREGERSGGDHESQWMKSKENTSSTLAAEKT